MVLRLARLLLAAVAAGLLAALLLVQAPLVALTGASLGPLFLGRKRRRADSRPRAKRRGLFGRRQQAAPIRRTKRSSRSRSGGAFGITLANRGRGIAVVGALVVVMLMLREVPSTTGRATQGLPELATPAAVVILLGLALVLAIRLARRGNRGPAPLVAFDFADPGHSTVARGTAFEEAVAMLLREWGYRHVRRVGGAGDRGIDLLAEDPHGRLVVVQCKHYRSTNAVSSQSVQMLIGAVANEGANLGLLVTTSRFTTAATSLAANGRVAIRLIDGAELAQLSHGRLTAVA